ncbi:hypothetical protein POM88_050797 [Heracleum sosnowskyi]|uniref:DUF3615 domain-containing protein n=1 Tax=Heracleum sosnowskyi TaxID=360622 RepID=A0AAD8M1U9_9APIA|nr:hypothetical protein POM88_050797 [Heracleum sosnowskyi]
MTRIDVRPGSRRLAKIFKNLRSRVVYLSNPRPRRYRRVRRDKKEPPHRAIVAAFNYLNQNSDLEYQLLRPRCVTPVVLYNCILLHVDFVAKKAHVDDAPEEMFFAELRLAHGTHVYSPRLCISLGPIDSISGDRMNGCCYCRGYNSVCHPKGGGFVRGHDGNYKTVQDIYDTDMLKQVPPAREPTKESDYSLQHVDNASQYATEVVKFVNQTKDKNYEVVKPGFATRVILTEDCSLFHVNFKAKENDPNAPVKLFFAEFTTTNEVFSFKCCVELGQKAIDLGDLTGDKTNGCYYCHDFNKVCHPTLGGFVRGGDSLYKPVSELRCSAFSQWKHTLDCFIYYL